MISYYFQTFIDDPLRVLRTFRFATKLEFTVIPQIAEAIKNPAIRVSFITNFAVFRVFVLNVLLFLTRKLLKRKLAEKE